MTKYFWFITTVISLTLNLIVLYSNSSNLISVISTRSKNNLSHDYSKESSAYPLIRCNIDKDGNVNYPSKLKFSGSLSRHITNVEKSVGTITVTKPNEADPKTETIKILCLVMTQPSNLRTKAQAVKDTWGKRCNKLLFISSVADPVLPALGFNTPEGLLKLL